MGLPFSSWDIAFMTRALVLAEEGLGRVAPNPSVGCVIMRRNKVVGEARTGDGGRPHAEEGALAQAGDAARGATAYVTLEPCAKRSSGAPSCSELLVHAGLSRVVIAAADPHPNADGAGLLRLRAAGIAVETRLLAEEAEALNVGFLTLTRTRLPWVGTSGDGAGFDAELILQPGEDEAAALARLGAEGMTRVWRRIG